MKKLSVNQESAGNPTAELFDQVWQKGIYQGFSRGTSGEMSTPFLDLFTQYLRPPELEDRRPRIVELGAGSCDHSIRLGSEGFDVTAVEYSQTAITPALKRLARRPTLNHRVRIVRADLFAYVSGLSESSREGVYANSVLHFMSCEQRVSLYQVLRESLVNGGLLAVSFKFQGDALENRGRVVENTPAGPIREGQDGIRRLFVSNPQPLIEEIRGAGFRLVEIIQWTVPDYNVDGEPGKFVGLIARCEKGQGREL